VFLLLRKTHERLHSQCAADGVHLPSYVPAVADALADLMYVVAGTAVAYGIDLGPILLEVHRTNMAKAGGSVRPILKPAGWQPPDVAGLLRAQGWHDC